MTSNENDITGKISNENKMIYGTISKRGVTVTFPRFTRPNMECIATKKLAVATP
jgi:hypothetical protein